MDISSQSHTAPMMEIRTGLPKLVVTDAELFYAREFDDNQEILLFGFSLSDLSGLYVSYMRVKWRGGTHINTYVIIFVDDSDICCALTKELSLILGREGSFLVLGRIRVPVPDAKLNVCNPQTNLAGIFFLLGVELILVRVDIARFFKRLLHFGRRLAMSVVNTEGAPAYNDLVVI